MADSETAPTLDDRVRDVVRTLGAEIGWPCPADLLALFTYTGLKTLTERSLVHVDPQLAYGTTALRHVLDVVCNAKVDDLEDVQMAIRVGFEFWLDAPDDPSADDSRKQ